MCGITLCKKKQLLHDAQVANPSMNLLLTRVFSFPQLGPSDYAPETHEPQDRSLVSLNHILDFIRFPSKRRPKGIGWLTSGALKDLRAGYDEQETPVREGRGEAANLERRLSALVNEAYGLMREEVEMLWATAPPRMPKF